MYNIRVTGAIATEDQPHIICNHTEYVRNVLQTVPAIDLHMI